MDPAQVIMQKALVRQEKMNAVIDRGDSPVQQFYRGATVFVTGGSGYLGKHLIEKLLRSCDIKKVYVLLRSKKDKNIQSRLQNILNDPLYELLREKKPGFEDKIVAVEGNVDFIRLGISDDNWATLTKEVNFIFHLAATVKFDSPLKEATLTNVRGTRETLNLAKDCDNFKNFIYVSTAFTHASADRANTEVLEQFYPVPLPPEVVIDMAETVDDSRLNDITNGLIKGWPNTYTFTKALSEELVRTTAGDLPVCVVRPPIVAPCYYEPSPGWLDNTALQGPTGIVFGIGMGVLHTFYIDESCYLPITPLDYVTNATIAAGWDSIERRNKGEKDIRVYTVSNKDEYIKWNLVGDVMRNDIRLHAATPKMIWYGFMIETKQKLVFWILSLLLHYIPAYIMDAVCAITGKRPKEIPSFVGVYKKIDKFAKVYNFFILYEWYFRDHHVKEMINNMNEADKAIFNCDLKSINYREYIAVWCMGLRKFILKDGLVGSDIACQKEKLYISISIVIGGVFACVMLYMLYIILTTALGMF